MSSVLPVEIEKSLLGSLYRRNPAATPTEAGITLGIARFVAQQSQMFLLVIEGKFDLEIDNKANGMVGFVQVDSDPPEQVDESLYLDAVAMFESFRNE